MNFLSMIIRFFQGGGEMMYPIAVVLVIGVVIAIERYIVLTHTALKNRSFGTTCRHCWRAETSRRRCR